MGRRRATATILPTLDGLSSTFETITSAEQKYLRRRVRLASGAYYQATPSGGLSTSGALGVGSLRMSPLYIPYACTLDRIGAEVTTIGDAGSKIRLGIYDITADGLPGALILDAGTINGDSATVQELTISQALEAGLYWVGAAVQVVTTTQPTLRVLSSAAQSAFVPLPLSTGGAPSAGTTAAVGLFQTGVTGALPATASTSLTPAGTMPRIHVRAA